MTGKEIVKIIDERLDEMGISQKDFCAEIGISSAAMSAWRNGSMPKPERIKEIERALKIRYLGWSEATVMREGGWADKTTVHDVYTHLAAQDANADISKMVQFFTEKPKENPCGCNEETTPKTTV